MNRLAPVIAVLLLFAGSTPALAGDEWSGNAALLWGQRNLDSADWSPVEGQQGFGFAADFGRNQWPIRLYASAVLTGNQGGTVGKGGAVPSAGEIRDFSLGLAFRPDLDGIEPYVAAGGSLLSVTRRITPDIGGTERAETDTVGAGFVAGGLAIRVQERFTFGVDVRYTSGSKATLFDTTYKIDSLQYAATLGWLF